MSDVEGIRGFLCPKCKWSDVFPTDICPQCHSATSAVSFSEYGKIATFTVIRYPPEGFEKDAPYVVGLIDIESGPRVIGRIASNPENLQIGMSVSFARTRNGALEFQVHH